MKRYQHCWPAGLPPRAVGCGERDAFGQRVTWALVSQADLAKPHTLFRSETKQAAALLQRPPCRVRTPCLGRRHHRAHRGTSVPLGCFLAGELRGTSAVSLHWAQSSSWERQREGLGEACRQSNIISSSLEQKGDREVNRGVLNSCYLPAFAFSLHLASPTMRPKWS